MFLHRLYSEPAGLFETVEFQKGLNFIYARKDDAKDKKKSLNGLGKSLLLNLIDYCLLSGESKHIKSAKENNDLGNYVVVLEFKIDGNLYVIKRGFNTPNKGILFGKKGELEEFNHTAKDHVLSRILCDLIFKNENYEGKYSNTCLRQLIPFFIKAQSSKTKTNFKDPITYLYDGSKEREIIPYHLFLMGINNSLFVKNNEIMSELKAKRPALVEVKTLVEESYNLRDIDQAESEALKLETKVAQDEKRIQGFELAKQYSDVESQSNELTAKIKDLWHDNYLDRKKVDEYEKSITQEDKVSVTKIKNMYNELNKLLAENIKITLDEAMKFRKNLSKSRQDFLQTQIASIKEKITERDEEISELEKKRIALFNFLEAKEAIKDLSEAYLDLSRKRERLSELQGQLRTYHDLSREVSEREAASSSLFVKIETFCLEAKDELNKFRSVFHEVHDAIYEESKDRANFIFAANKKKDSKVNIDVNIPSNLSYGKNKGRTLIYDLSMLFYTIQQNIKCPRFLIHDGIFDGLDKAHFVHLYHFLNQKEREGVEFQYIVTLNQEGTVKDLDFGEGAEDITNNKIEEESIVLLSPKNPLFGKHWD